MNPLTVGKIRQMKPEEMVFVFDFDGTIHKKHINGKETPSIISILRDENILNQNYSEKARKLSETYRPIEKDSSISSKEKISKMEEWWQKHINLLIENKLSQKNIQDISFHPLLVIREGITELFIFARENNIPIIIFSASGTGSDSIKYFLERYNILFKNVIIISNNFEYENGVIKNIIPPIIHALNKNESVLSFFPETRRLILKKKFVLLIGDSVNDVNMVENKNHTNIIRVGILNELNLEKKKEILPFFQEKFDLVIEDDGSLVPIYEVLISKS